MHICCLFDYTQRFSSLYTLLHTFSFCFRFIHNLKSSQFEQISGPLTTYFYFSMHFGNEINSLENNQIIAK